MICFDPNLTLNYVLKSSENTENKDSKNMILAFQENKAWNRIIIDKGVVPMLEQRLCYWKDTLAILGKSPN